MRVLYLNSVYKKGSTGKIVAALHTYCRSHDFESFVIYGRGERFKEPFIYKSSSELLSKINQVRARITGYVYGGNFISTHRIIRKIKKIKPDIIHIHNLNDQFVNEYILLKFLAKTKIKVLITLHSEQMYTGTCGYALDCNQYAVNGCRKCEHIYLSTHSNVDKTKKAFNKLKSVYSQFDKGKITFTSCTPWLKNRGNKSILIGNFNNLVVLNGADSSVFKGVSNSEAKKIKDQYGLPQDKKIILHVNPRADDPIKGYQFLSKFSEQIPDDCCICVVGKIPQNPLKNKKIIHLGEIRRPFDLAGLYAASDLTLMLSSRECFPMVIVESLLCETPVVAFKCGGPDDCFPSEFVGFAEYGDLKDLIQKAFNLMLIDRKKIGVYAKDNLTSDIMCQNFIKIYNRL